MTIEAHMASDKYEKANVVKGPHVYKSIWTPVIGQELQVKPEYDNEHDKHAISVIMGDRTVGHLPQTISCDCATPLTPGVYWRPGVYNQNNAGPPGVYWRKYGTYIKFWQKIFL